VPSVPPTAVNVTEPGLQKVVEGAEIPDGATEDIELVSLMPGEIYWHVGIAILPAAAIITR
jgi:hypothetical protein